MKSVKLVTEHTHAGVKYYPGQTIELDDADAAWYSQMVVGVRQAQTDAVEASPAGVAIRDALVGRVPPMRVGE